MQNKIEQWVDQTIATYASNRTSCICFENEFKGYYPGNFLQESYFVVVNKLPKPDFPELRDAGFSDFLDREFEGITYKNTYFITAGCESRKSLHFHELVHVMQWKVLGAQQFIVRYMQELKLHGYDNAPLEVMASEYQHRFEKNEDIPDLLNNIKMEI